MKVLVLVALLVGLAAPTYANDSRDRGYGGWFSNIFSGFGWTNNNRRGGGHNGRGHHGGGHHWGGHGNPHNPRSVPELDGAMAPLAGVLIAGLLAAGAERRRRRKK